MLLKYSNLLIIIYDENQLYILVCETIQYSVISFESNHSGQMFRALKITL